MHHPHLQVSGPEYLPPVEGMAGKTEKGLIEADTHTKKGYLLPRKAWGIEAKCRNDPRIVCKEGNRLNTHLRNKHSVPSVKLYLKGRNQHPQGGLSAYCTPELNCTHSTGALISFSHHLYEKQCHCP